jgi:predicted DNA-binding transcriptional regulator AlpA
MHFKADARLRFIDKKQLRQMILYSSSQIDRLEKRGLLPKRVRLGPNRVAWREHEILEWMANCAPKFGIIALSYSR